MGIKRIRMFLTTSSYEKNNFRKEFKKIISRVNPKLIIEFGIGNGYSLECLVKYSSKRCNIMAFDLFDNYNYNKPDEKFIRNKFKDDAVIINKGDFYNLHNSFQDGTIDILHIDISNDGDVYEFAIKNYLQKVSDTGCMILEGGSNERDNVAWMVQFNKKKINPYLKKIAKTHKIELIEKFPSLTIIKK